MGGWYAEMGGSGRAFAIPTHDDETVMNGAPGKGKGCCRSLHCASQRQERDAPVEMTELGGDAQDQVSRRTTEEADSRREGQKAKRTTRATDNGRRWGGVG